MKIARNLLTGVYVLLLVPAVIFGTVAYSDFRHLGCPGANQCSDALTIWASAAIFAVVGLLIVGALWFAVAAASRRGGEHA